MALAVFGPFALLGWLGLDFHSASRFSIGYAPLFALLAAEGIPRRARVAGSALLAAAMIVWCWPALRTVRRTDSPPVAAARSLRALDPARSVVCVDRRLAAHAEVLLPEFRRLESGAGVPAVMHERAEAVLLREGASRAVGARNFLREDEPLASLARRRYFAVSVVPVQRIGFGEGWYAEEGDVRTPFRWMSRRGVVHLPARPSRVVLAVRFAVPDAARVTIHAGGRLLESIDADPGSFERSWELEGVRELTIETDHAIRPAGDSRDLGLRLDSIVLQ